MNIPNFSNKIEVVRGLIDEADAILIGAGAGLSAAAGLNYGDVALFQKWYPVLANENISTIGQAISTYWNPTNENRTRFWAFWANHIHNIRYAAPPGKVYLDLYELVYDRKHFIITTNVDGQFVKAGFDKEVMFSPQGDYALFQCEKPCNQTVYDNQDYIQKMIGNMDQQKFVIQEADIPICPNCGGFLVQNLRKDSHFVETPHIQKEKEYFNFVNNSVNGKLVLLELGVGFNTPVIIRWPFEKIVSRHPNATLIRINMTDANVPETIETKSIGFNEDVSTVIRELANKNRLA
jgi:NAD-dependent SIR2 family protein deacetylase